MPANKIYINESYYICHNDQCMTVQQWADHLKLSVSTLIPKLRSKNRQKLSEILRPNLNAKVTCRFCGTNKHVRKVDQCGECKKKTRDLIRRILIHYRGSKCKNCGYDSCVPCLHFHHRDPKEKSFNITIKMNEFTPELIEEADKCDVLCARCHCEEHNLQ